MELRVVWCRSLVVSTGASFAEFVVSSGHAPGILSGQYYASPGMATTDDHDCIGWRAQEPSSLSPGGTTRTAPNDLGDAASVENHKSFYSHRYTLNNTAIHADLAMVTRAVVPEHPAIPQIFFAQRSSS